jgi:hypothetical protein
MAARNLLFTIAGNVHTNTLASQFYNFNSGTLSGITKLTTGAHVLGYVGKTANYTIQDGDYTINVTANSITITLLTAVGRAGQVFVVKNSGDATIAVAPTGGQEIDGISSPTALAVGKFIMIQSDGANWIIIGTNIVSGLLFQDITDSSPFLIACQSASSPGSSTLSIAQVYWDGSDNPTFSFITPSQTGSFITGTTAYTGTTPSNFVNGVADS